MAVRRFRKKRKPHSKRKRVEHDKIISYITLEQSENGFSTTNKKFKEKIKNQPKRVIKEKVSSKGEEIIEKYLILKNIQYKREYIIPGCLNPKTQVHLPFDFYLIDSNTCIEFDGIQHFKPSIEFHGDKAEEEFKQQKYRDIIKTNFCFDNKIRLIRLNYRQYGRIEEVLNRLL